MDLLSKRYFLCEQSTSKVRFCKYYILCKYKRVNFQMSIHKTKGTLDYICLDLRGTSYVPYKGGTNYFTSFINKIFEKFGCSCLSINMNFLYILRNGKLFSKVKLRRKSRG